MKHPEAYVCFSCLSLIKAKDQMLTFDSVKAFLCRAKVLQHRHGDFHVWSWHSTRAESIELGRMGVQCEANEEAYQDWYSWPFSEVQVFGIFD